MALRKEWLATLARLIQECPATGPAYGLGDHQTFFTEQYAQRELIKHGLLRNADAPKKPDHIDPRFISFESVVRMAGIQEYVDIDFNGKARITADLSQTLPEELRGVAGYVLDL